MRRPIERRDIGLAPIDESFLARTHAADDSALPFDFARQRLVDGALSRRVALMEQAVVAVPIVNPAGII
jgi:hypothetical protein